MLKLREAALSKLKACLGVFPAPVLLWSWFRKNLSLSVLIALIALLVSIWSAYQNSVVVQHQRQEARLTMARQVTVTLRPFNANVDPFVWGGPRERELLKDFFITVQVFNDGDAEIQDVVVDLLIMKYGEWTLLGQEKLDRLGPHKETPAVVGGTGIDEMAFAKGLTYTDEHGKRWVRWSDGRLLAK